MSMTTTTGGAAGSVARGLVLLGLAAALGVGFVGFTPFRLGYWGASEAIGATLHASAALVALGLALLAMVDRERVAAALATPVAWPPLLLSAWSFAVAPAANYPWLSVFGAPQTSEGAILHLDMALWTLGGLCLRGQRGWSLAVVAAAAVPAIAMPALFVAAPGSRLYFYPDWLAFYGLLAPAAVVGFWPDRGQGEGRLKVWLLAGLVAVVPLAVAQNRAAVAAAVAALAAFLILERAQWLDRFWRPLVGFGLALLPGLGLLAIWQAAEMAPFGTLWSRLQAIIVAFGVFPENPWTWVTGEGWGHDMLTLLRHLDRSGATQYHDDGAIWDLAVRDYFHSHHGGFEALLSAGLPGLIVFCSQAVVLALTAPRARRWLAGATAAGWSVTLCLWFQADATMAFQGLAFAALAGPPITLIRLPKPVLAGSLGLAAAGLVAGSVFLIRFGLPAQKSLEIGALTATVTPPAACADYPSEDWRGDLGLARMVGGRILQAQTLGFAGDRGDRLEASICLLEQRVAERQSLYLMFWAIEFRNRVAHLDAFVPVRPRFAPLFEGWASLLDRTLTVAPGRTDLAIGYFGWAITTGRHAEAALLGDRLLHRRPDDPVILWFSGNAMLFNQDLSIARQGMRRMKRALALGVDRFVPIDPGLKRRVEAA